MAETYIYIYLVHIDIDILYADCIIISVIICTFNSFMSVPTRWTSVNIYA